MTEKKFDKKRIAEYFNSGGNLEEETYIGKLFIDPSQEPELKKHLSDQFLQMTKSDSDDDPILESVLHRIHYEINCRSAVPRKRKIPLITWLSGAVAAVLIPLLLIWGLRVERQAKLNRETWVEVTSPAWSRTRFSLPDGSTGWLNSRSSLKYRGNFLADRKVILSGEAFFDVEHNPSSPFHVIASDVEVQVLGTRFNIASYSDEQVVDVVLETGSLNLNLPTTGKSYRLSPNDRVTYHKNSGDLTRESVNPSKYIAWTEGKLVFRNDPIDVIARQLERWYNIDVELKIDRPENLRWRATFADESLEEVLKLLKRSLHVDYRIQTRVIRPDDTVPQRKIILTNMDK